MHAIAVSAFFLFFCSGCGGMRDAIIRELHLDHEYRRKVLPQLLDGYERKMDTGNPPAIPVPGFPDQG